MATKLEKLGEELKKTRAKYEEYGRRVKELEERYREEENAAIHAMVHAANLSPEQLAEIIARAMKGNVGEFPEGMEPANGGEEVGDYNED